MIASVVVGDLTPGTYTGRITISADGVSNSPVQVPVTLTVRRPQPVFDRRGVVNAATFVATPVAPGEIISIFGSRLGPEPGVALRLEPGSQKLPETLAGTRITFGGVPAPLFFVSYKQVNLQVPFEVARDTSSRMVVSVEGIDPAEMSVEVADAVPGVFTVDGTRAAALNQDSTVNGPENPAPIGSVVQLFLTGQGALDIAVPTGVLAPAAPPFPRPLLPVFVNMDGFESRILFAGLAPGFAGLMQVNAEVPRGVTPSDSSSGVGSGGL